MSTKVIRATGANVSPAEDARLFRQMFQADGLFYDAEITARGGSQVYIPSLYGILEGRDFTTDPMNFNVDLPNSDGTGYILVRFDTATDDIISIVSELAPYTPVYEDINAGGTICEMLLATYTATPTQVSTITMTYTMANFGGKMEGTLNTGDTSIAFSNPLFTNDTYFDVYTDSSAVKPTGWSFAGNTFTISFNAQSAAHKIGVVYKNYN
jgi:hypothetical protein